MKYGTIYTLPFKSRKENNYLIEIQKENYEGESILLVGSGESPFVVSIDDDDFLYTPSRFSTATIRIVGSDYLQSLFSTAYQQYRVLFKRNDTITWCGFVKPELYTQDYSSEIFELEVECMSAMSTLEYIKYKQVDTNGKIFVSLWDLLKRAIEISRGTYSSVLLPYVYSKSEETYNSGAGNVLEEMTISEQDFFDEDDKPMTWKEVLEEICRLLNWTCVDWKGELYFIDIDHIGNYREYDVYLGSYKLIQPHSELSIQHVGYAGNEHSFDLMPGYNKVTVKTSNYPVGDITPEEDYDKLKRLTIIDSVDGNAVSHKILYSSEIIKTYSYRYESNTGDILLDDKYIEQNKNKSNNFRGALPAKCCEYEMKKEGNDFIPSIREYVYDEVIQIRFRNEGDSSLSTLGTDVPIISIKCQNTLYEGSGAFSISGELRMCRNSEMGYLGEPEDDFLRVESRCYLRVGNLWYNGTIFKEEKAYFTIVFERENGEKWFRIRDTKTLNMPYSGMGGKIIEIGKYFPVQGDVELTVCSMRYQATYEHFGAFLKGFKLSYQDGDGVGKTESNSDRLYENIVNEDYINELDEIEFKISSYNNDGACYSKVLLGDNYLTDNLYSSIENTLVRPEEHLIRRIIKQYGATKIKLTQILLNNESITPVCRLSDKYTADKIFIVSGGEIDYDSEQFKCVMIEI